MAEYRINNSPLQFTGFKIRFIVMAVRSTLYAQQVGTAHAVGIGEKPKFNQVYYPNPYNSYHLYDDLQQQRPTIGTGIVCQYK